LQLASKRTLSKIRKRGAVIAVPTMAFKALSIFLLEVVVMSVNDGLLGEWKGLNTMHTFT
jgi:hypothetical protein